MPQETDDDDKKNAGLPPSPIPGRSDQNSNVAGKSEPNLPPHLRALTEKTAEVAKTKLDYDAVSEVVIKNVSKKEVQIAEQILAQQSEPAKPFIAIESEKAAPCSAKTDDKEKVGFCEQCHCRFYDFTGMEMPEAAELIFKMEGLEKFRLFKRRDGKYLTKDCPVGRKRRFWKMMAIGGAAIMIFGFAILTIMAPHTLSTAPVQTESASPQDSSALGKQSSTADDVKAHKSAGTAPVVIQHHYGAKK